ncbi:hypothetical protein [Halorussus amylolyticus]|uniref:hypothetical protein n=1 Tax=Halorussus amylolyticus TaxID=1126242 RepID=UPI00104D6E7F|nr:hypothetical protein [Halorussus amylolyticus]
MTDDAPTFDIPRRPTRSYPREGGVEHEGGTVFHLSPDVETPDSELAALVEGVLSAERYTYGDWFELPKPVYLVHDQRHATAFRVVVRYGTVEFHVLPETASAALESLYDRIRAESEWSWRVECETSDD